MLACSLKCVGSVISAALLRLKTADDILEAFQLLVAGYRATKVHLVAFATAASHIFARTLCCVDVGALLADNGHWYLHLLHNLSLLG